MADTEFVQFPGGQVQMGTGDLQHAISAKFSFKNNVKVQSTLRKNAAGYTIGVHEADGNIDTIVSVDGPEREYLKKALDGEPVQVRYKAPTLTVTFEGIIAQVDGDFQTGTEIKLNIALKGKLTIA